MGGSLSRSVQECRGYRPDPGASGVGAAPKMTPNKHMERAVIHKLLGRGRGRPVLERVDLARALTGQRAGADVNR